MQRSDYIIRKILFAVLTIALVVVFNFLLFRILPGDPVKMLIHSPRMTKEAQETIKKDFGLDKEIWLDGEKLESGDIKGAFDSQFTAYIRNLLKGNFGVSFRNRRPVSEILSERVWKTVFLLFSGELVAGVFGIAFGLLAAWKRGTTLDTTMLLWALFSWALPTFFLGIILLILVKGSLPSGGMITPGISIKDGLVYWTDLGRHLVLPTVTMAIVFTGEYIMIMRSGAVEVLSEDYILTAKAKGMNTFQILRDHVLKNAMLPMVTVITVTLGYIVAGSIQVETVFSWPGIGRLMYESVKARDYPVLQGAFLLLAVSVVAANLLADFLYTVIDPRIKAD